MMSSTCSYFCQSPGRAELRAEDRPPSHGRALQDTDQPRRAGPREKVWVLRKAGASGSSAQVFSDGAEYCRGGPQYLLSLGSYISVLIRGPCFRPTAQARDCQGISFHSGGGRGVASIEAGYRKPHEHKDPTSKALQNSLVLS